MGGAATLVATLDAALDPWLVDTLDPWLRTQRWFPVKGSEVTCTPLGGIDLTLPSPSATAGSGEPRVRVLLVAVEAPAVRTVLQVPLLLVHAEQPPSEALAWRSGLAVHDGVGAPSFVAAWLAAAEGPVTEASVRAQIDPLASRVLTGEQSNTSVVLAGADGPVAVLKVLRSLTSGDNPDVDVPRHLVEAGWDAVPAPLGWLRATWPGAEAPGHLAAMATFVPDAADGFELACDHARRGASFTDLATDLGSVVASMHRALVTAYGTYEHQGAAQVAAALRERLAWAVPFVPTLAERVDEIEAKARALEQHADLPPRQRVHGDLHLGQVLRSHGRWFVTDFEGEPLAPVETRTRPDLALRDVAGVLRSFDYAAAVGGLTGEAADGWVESCRSAFLGTCLGDASQHAQVLAALELDKVIYEVVYESRNRPDWVSIPLHGLDRLLA